MRMVKHENGEVEFDGEFGKITESSPEYVVARIKGRSVYEAGIGVVYKPAHIIFGHVVYEGEMYYDLDTWMVVPAR